MRRDDHGRAMLGRQAGEQLDDLAARAGVQIPGRLVGEHHAWVDRQRTRDRHALLLAARELTGQMVGALGEPHLAEQLERSLSRTADRDELCLDVLHRGERRDQVELLEDESERAQAERRELAVAEAGRGPGPRRSRRRRSAGRARRAAGAASSSRSRSAPRARRTRPRRAGGRRRRARARSSSRAGRTSRRRAARTSRSSVDLPQRIGGAEPSGAHRTRRAGDETAEEREPEAQRRGRRRRSARRARRSRSPCASRRRRGRGHRCRSSSSRSASGRTG